MATFFVILLKNVHFEKSLINKSTFKKSSSKAMQETTLTPIIKLFPKIFIIPESASVWYFRKNKPMQPIKNVIINWLIPLNMDIEMALILFSFATNNIRPPYSPMRLGVIIVILHPAKTALKALLNDILSNGFINFFHFIVSSPQFINIRKKTNQKNAECQLLLILSQLE